MTVAEIGVHDIKRMALRGGLAKLVGQAGTLTLRLGFMVVAARLLEPEDFGLVAMVTVVTAILDLFTTAGLSSATVQKATISNEQISTLFWINLLVGLILGVLCLLLAPLLVTFYREPRLFWVTVVMGTGFLFNAAGVQQLALLQRQMRYTTLAALEFSCQLTSLGLGICLALAGYGYWALVAAAISLPATMTVGMWLATAWVPGRPNWDAGIRSMLHFGGILTLNGVVSYLTYNFDKFILGRVWGASALGYYGVASQLINIPTSNLNTAIGGVTFSTLSRLQNDVVRFRNYFLKGYALNISLTLPVTIFAAVFARDIILVVLGSKWAETAILFRLLAPTVLVFGIINPLGWLLWSSGRHVRSLKISLAIAVLVITACLIGLARGPEGVAIGFSAAMVLWLVPHVVWCLHGTAITPSDIFRATSGPLVSAVFAVGLAYMVHSGFSSLPSPLLQLALAGSAMALAYSGLMICFMGKDFYLDLVRAMRSTSSSSAAGDRIARVQT
jgi:O-antigen/teichoic acid export membrane protein